MCSFREATEADFEAICKLITDSRELFFVYPAGQYPLTPDQLRTIAKKRFELTVAVDGDEIVGFANLFNATPRISAFIGNLIVARSHRGRGVAREMVSYMEVVAAERHHLPTIKLSVFGENTPALLLYNSLGYSPYEVEERTTPQGDRVALIHMKKSLSKAEEKQP